MDLPARPGTRRLHTLRQWTAATLPNAPRRHRRMPAPTDPRAERRRAGSDAGRRRRTAEVNMDTKCVAHLGNSAALLERSHLGCFDRYYVGGAPWAHVRRRGNVADTLIRHNRYWACRCNPDQSFHII